jgi:hypothetical protein
VFGADCLTTSRRWQVYAGRSLLVASVLVAMTLIWLTRVSGGPLPSIKENAAIGLALVDAIMAVELVLAIAIVPAVAAGAICQDKMRGGLTLMMVTDLSNAEIVLGKLASFNRLLGRMPVVRTAVTDGPWPRSLSIGQPRQAHRSPS